MRPASETDQSLVPGSWDQLLKYMPAVNDNSYFSHFKDVDFTFSTLDDIVDSSNITPGNWKEIAAVIQDNYEEHTGFVIIHGTDTLAYTASALSFMFQNLGKPVVITGSQLPVFHPRTDAIANLSNSIYIAAYQSFNLPMISEVCICFNDDILRGNRSVKRSTHDFEGFSSPNFDHLGWLDLDIAINTSLELIRPNGPFEVIDSFSDKVVNVTLFPGYDPKVLFKLIEERAIEGIVLKTFGSGNISNNPIWENIVEKCIENDVLILATTQCQNGSIDLGKYKASEVLLSHNVVNGYDITSEAALTKLMWVIGNYDMQERRKQLTQNIRGEITIS